MALTHLEEVARDAMRFLEGYQAVPDPEANMDYDWYFELVKAMKRHGARLNKALKPILEREEREWMERQ